VSSTTLDRQRASLTTGCDDQRAVAKFLGAGQSSRGKCRIEEYAVGKPDPFKRFATTLDRQTAGGT